ncbi:MAG: hypothetical protein ACMXYK_01160 [Candidatus Woesearchaeota archaeon]
MKKLLLLGLMVLMASVVFADTITDSHEICTYILEETVLEVGSVIDGRLMYSNDVFNAFSQGEVVGHIVLDDRVVTSMGCDLVENPTFIVEIKDLETIEAINTAESTFSALDSAMSRGDISLQGQSLGKRVKGFLTRAAVKVASWFA